MKEKLREIRRGARDLVGQVPFIQRNVLHRTEGIRQEQLDYIDEMIEHMAQSGAITTCAIIFGSRARDFAHEGSDLDVLFIVKYEDFKNVLDIGWIWAPYQAFYVAEEQGFSLARFEDGNELYHFACIDEGKLDLLFEGSDPEAELIARSVAKGSSVYAGVEPEVDGELLIATLRNIF